MCQLGMSNEELMKFLTQETNKPEFTNKLTDYYTKVKSAIPDKSFSCFTGMHLIGSYIG